jgi:hypothetical protein
MRSIEPSTMEMSVTMTNSIPIEIRRIFSPDTQKTWEEIAAYLPDSAYLVGGNAVAVYLQHRENSRDLDFYLSSPVDLVGLHDQLAKTGRWEASEHTGSTLNGVFNRTKLQFLLADNETILEPLTVVGGVPVASLPDLFAMKLGVITRRGALRDYFDLMEMEKRAGLSVEDGLSLYVRRYHPIGVDAALAAVVFALGADGIRDAESDPVGIPRGTLKELRRYWPKRQIEVTRHLDRYGSSAPRSPSASEVQDSKERLNRLAMPKRRQLCGAWMPIARARCILPAGHGETQHHRSKL